MTQFNPRLRPSDVILVVGLLALLVALITYALSVLSPGLDVDVGIRIAFGIAVGSLFVRMKLFPAPPPVERNVPPARRALSLVLFGIGGTIFAIGAAVFSGI